MASSSSSSHSHSHDHGGGGGGNDKGTPVSASGGGGGGCSGDHSHDHSHGGGNEQRGLFVPSGSSPSAKSHGGDVECREGDDYQHEHNNDEPELTDDELARRNAMRRLKIASGLCVAFFCVEVVGGYVAGSLAVLSDAAHLFSDMASFAVAIFANYLAGLPSTTSHTFGLKRSESLAALFSMISLALVCVWLGIEAVQRLYVMTFQPDVAAIKYEVDGALMSGIAAIGVLVNLVLAWVLGAEGHVHMPGADHGHSHSHDHGSGSGESSCNGHSHDHDHGETTTVSAAATAGAGGHSHDDHDHDHLEEGAAATETTCLLAHKAHPYVPEHFNEVPPPPSLVPDAQSASAKPRNVNLQAAYLHVLGDLAQSVAVLVAGIVIWFKPSWTIVDPLCTLGFCVVVFCSTIGVVRASMSVLLEEVPPQISWRDIHKDLTSISHLRDVHDLHIWCISDGVPSLSLHASCDDGQCEPALKAIAEVCKKYGIEHITAQVQPGVGDCITCEHVVSSACFES